MFWQPYAERETRQPHERLKVLKSWLDECLDHHDGRSSSAHDLTSGLLPRRVLDLTDSPRTPSSSSQVQIRLRETSKETQGKYIALSYCWGQETENHFTTKSQNIGQHRERINFDSLPLTRREAVLVALYLDVRYLWIDSLRIVQDIASDRAAEAANMSSVYLSAMLRLAATACRSPQDGLPNPPQSARCVPIDDDMAMVRMQTHTDVNSASEPLNTRAWSLQEAILSQRMVCFGSEQWLWRCSSRCATEDGCEDRVPMNTEGLHRAPLSATRRPDETRQLYVKQWYQLVRDYSRRKLTYQRDKLSAIAGLADICAKQTGFQYVAGLWVGDIGAGLMWQATSTGVTRGHSPFPSWSWASTEGAILTQDFTEADTSMIGVLKVDRDLNEYTSATLCATLGCMSALQP